MTSESFFRNSYIVLREHSPMKWMERLFSDLCCGKYPRLVDLPTGAGKTELVVIWLLALAWYGQNGAKGSPVPRKLVWVVNRRVLVQQVFKIAGELRGKLASNESPELNVVRAGLRNLSGAEKDVLEVVELRGQIVADRDWAIRPAVPQIVIGTVDQIGSRLLFQGYGLGKWGRPQQAGLLGVDAWFAVDEAHLVPAFVLTLRQLRERCSSAADNLPPPFNAIFLRLPFWLTELSATPGLPPPSSDRPFSLTDEEKDDAAIADRILAARARQVQIEVLPKAEKPKEVLVKVLIEAAQGCKAMRVAIFVREVGIADQVAAGIKKAGIPGTHICKITGRIRGYERDHLAQQDAFNVFLSARTEPTAGASGDSFFLIGTAAAEVGLDADADVILCDFASLPTLLQRLGRLDRRGVLSRRHAGGNGEPPTMRVFDRQEEIKPNTQKHLSNLAKLLKDESRPYSATLMAGTHWLPAGETKDKDTAEASKTDAEAKEEKSAKNLSDPLIVAATWKILDPKEGVCTPPNDWLGNDFARVAAGPVVVPPVTDAILDYWSATTDDRSPHLSPHPFLYGIAEDDEGTPLVGLVFRLEVEALRETTADDDAGLEEPGAAAGVLEIFERFPPLRAELHHVKLSAVREWLTSPAAEKHPLVYRCGDEWQAKLSGESGAAAAKALSPNATLILPANVVMRESCQKLIEDCQQSEDRDTALSDVLDGVSKSARYLREIEPASGRTGSDGAFLWNFSADEDKASARGAVRRDEKKWKHSLTKKLRIGGSEFTVRYSRPRLTNDGLQFLDDHDDNRGHLSRAETEAARLAEAIAPGDDFLRTLLSVAARHHDEGKRYPNWQRAFGRRKGQHEIAKLVPELEKPAPLHGFRHEWESLIRLTGLDMPPPPEIPPEAHALWHDLLLHLVGMHHGHLRPSIKDSGLKPKIQAEKQNPLRLEAAERFVRLQRQLGHWRLAYLESLLKTADAEGSRVTTGEEDHGN